MGTRRTPCKATIVVAVLTWLPFMGSHAGELVYQPVNPNFGGNPFNGAPLLAAASAQNNHKDPDRATGGRSASTFAEQLDRTILSRLSRQLVENAFGEDSSLDDGTFDTGVNTVTIETTEDATLITIVDNVTGEETFIEVPFF